MKKKPDEELTESEINVAAEKGEEEDEERLPKAARKVTNIHRVSARAQRAEPARHKSIQGALGLV